ncbi:MAG: hypothetical protein K6T74_07345 [Geminicoccaceae bacterium]|nr:hypothetical protein [Geminicoccaceae bacterium]
MPNASSWVTAVRSTLRPILFDIEPAQAIHDVVVTPEPENATITFATTRPCFATVELFRMVTGKVDLDMEKANRERIEVELFGNAQLSHRIRFFDLPQERRFWFRISVPGEGPGTALGQKKIRHRGWFSTFRRTATCGIDVIKILSDSDSASAGDLTFEVAAYDAARGDGRLDLALSGAFTVESGGFVRTPFAKVLDLGRVPDRVAVHLWGTDDDENAFVSFLEAPWKGLQIPGRLPPERRPPLRGPYSDRYRDSNDLEVVATLPVIVGRHQVRITGATPIAVLFFEMIGAIDCSVRDVLGQPPRIAGKLKPKMLALTAGRAGGLDLGGSRLALALGETGELLRREPGGGAGRWEVLESPPLRRLHLLAREQAPSLLVAVGRDGRIATALLDRVPPEALAWRETALVQAEDTGRAPALLEQAEGFLLACRDPAGRLVLQRLDREARPLGEPIALAEGVRDDIVLGSDGRGAARIAWCDRAGRITAGPLGAKPELAPVPGEVAALVGLAPLEEGDVVLAGLDRDGRVIARRLGLEEGWTVLGTLQEVVEPESLEPPPAEASAD